MAWRRRLAAAALLLAFGVLSILVASRVLSATPVRPSPPPTPGGVDKPPLYPPPAPLLNLTHFRYLLNADPCEDNDVTGVLLVTSHAEHVELRSAHRRAYPKSELLRLGLRRVFLLARPAGQQQQQQQQPWTQRALRNEGRRFSDLVQGDFNEAYRNLTYKHTMGLLWAAGYCPQAVFVIKMDDDIVVDLYQLLDYMHRQPPDAAGAAGALFGYVLHGLLPSREPANKWYVTKEEYAAETYPDFVSGWLYVTSPRVARTLAEGAAQVRDYFWIDDLLLTGLVRAALPPARRPDLRNASALFTVHPEVINCCLAEPDLRCDVLVGPNGGDNDLIVRLQAHAARCHYGGSCEERPPHRRVEQSCVVRASHADSRLPAAAAGHHGQARQVRMF